MHANNSTSAPLYPQSSPYAPGFIIIFSEPRISLWIRLVMWTIYIVSKGLLFNARLFVIFLSFLSVLIFYFGRWATWSIKYETDAMVKYSFEAMPWDLLTWQTSTQINK